MLCFPYPVAPCPHYDFSHLKWGGGGKWCTCFGYFYFSFWCFLHHFSCDFKGCDTNQQLPIMIEDDDSYLIGVAIVDFVLCAIHTLRVHYAHVAANLNSGYSKYAKVACVHYFCTIALQTSRAVLTRAWASCRVDLRERRVDLFSKRVTIFYW